MRTKKDIIKELEGLKEENLKLEEKLEEMEKIQKKPLVDKINSFSSKDFKLDKYWDMFKNFKETIEGKNRTGISMYDYMWDRLFNMGDPLMYLYYSDLEEIINKYDELKLAEKETLKQAKKILTKKKPQTKKKK